MKKKVTDIIDFEKVNVLLEGFNKSTGFVTAILDLDGNVLSKSGWRQICTQFHRVNPKTAQNCKISDTVLANEMKKGEKYHFYKCLNGLVDVAVPIVIKGVHIANLFSGQFFFELPDKDFFIKQAKKYGFNETDYIHTLENVPVVSEEKVKIAMDFLLDMTSLIVEISIQKLEQIELSKVVKESEEKYRLLHEAAGLGIGYYSPEGIVISYNNIAAQNMNGKPEDFAGKSIFDLFPKEIAEFYFERIKKACLSESPQKYEDKVELPVGTRWFSSVYSQISDAHHKILGIQIISTDITESKIAENELRQSEEEIKVNQAKLEVALDSMSDAVFISDIAGRFINFNQAFASFHKFADKEDCAKTFIEYPDIFDVLTLNNDLVPVNQWAVPSALRGETKTGVEYKLRRKDTKETWIGSYNYAPIRNSEGTIIGSVVTARDITERKKAEEIIIKQRRDFQEIINAAPVMISFKNLENVFVHVNKTLADFLDLPVDEIVGKTPFEIVKQREVAEQARLHDFEVMRTGKPILNQLIKWGGFKNNKEIWALYSKTPFYNEDGTIAGTLNFVNDVNDRVLAEQALKESEERLRLSTELANVAVWEYYCNSNTMTRSNNHDRLYGLETQKEWKFETFLMATHPDDRDYSNQIIQKSIAPGGPNAYKFDFRVVYPDQSIHWLMVTGQVTSRNPKGEALIVRGTLIDITDRIKAETKVKESESNLMALINNTNDSIWSLDRNYNYIIFNKTYADLFYQNYGSEVKKGMNAKQWLSEEEADFWIPMFESVFAGQKKTFEFSHQFDGESHYFQTSLNPIYEDDIVTGASAMSIEITNLKKAEEAVNILNEDLENRVAERTEELINSQAALMNLVDDLNEKSVQLERSSKMLEIKNKELETFTYSVSHDLKAPLRGIDGYSRLLEDSHFNKLDNEGQKFLKTIREGTKQMNQLIEDLLSYSRLERTAFRPTSINTVLFIDNILLTYKPEIYAKKITIEKEITEGNIIADADGLAIAFRNILENAIKFSGKTEDPKIKVILKENVSSWILSVNDNGIGFDMKYHDRIFEIFQRLNLPEQFPGTGIGLAMVKKTMERMQGNVWVESSPGKGSEFFLEIPKNL